MGQTAAPADVDAQTPVATPGKARPTAADPTDITIEYVADTIGAMNRLLTQLSALPAFEQASLGLQEWLALNALQGDTPLNNKQMVRHLGLAPNRAAQIVDSLRRAGLLSVVEIAGEVRIKSLQITDLGKTRLAEVNAQLFRKIMDGLAGEERSLMRANRGVRVMLRAITPRKPNA